MSIFEKLKKDQNNIISRKVAYSPDRLFFRHGKDENGVYVQAVDHKGEVTVFDYHHYTGAIRTLARELQQLQEKESYAIDWDNPDNQVYLHRYPYLVSLLLQSGHWQDGQGREIRIGAGKASISLEINALDEKALSSSLILETPEEHHTDFELLNEQYALAVSSGQVYEIAPVGAYANSIRDFATDKLFIADAAKYLSLFCSFTESISIKYLDYEEKRELSPVSPQPVLIFDKVDAGKALHLRVGSSLPNLDTDFTESYELSSLATVNELEKTVHIRPVVQESSDDDIALIERTLAKRLGKGKKKQTIALSGNLFIIPQEIAADFVYQDVPSLLGRFSIIGAQNLKEYKVNTSPPKLNLQLGHGIDFLEGDASLDFGGQQISLIDALNQYNKRKYIVLADGTHGLVNDQYMTKLQRLFKKKKDKVSVSFFDLPLVEELLEDRLAGSEFKKAREIYEGFNLLSKKKSLQPPINATLRPYQKQGIQWLQYLHEHKLGGCLADDMGLGKTIQTIGLLAWVYQKKKKELPSIIVMPKSLLFNWENELNKFAPQLSHYTWYGSNRDMQQALEADIILTTYTMLRIDIVQWKEQRFLYAILDESQTAKNTNSQVHKAVLLLQAAHRLALSGTPVENNLSELYALFNFLLPSMFGGAESFNQNYLNPIQGRDDKDASDELRRKIYPFILRRLKKDVLKDLPDKMEQTLYVEMGAEQARLYETRRQYFQQLIDQQVASKGIGQSQFYVFQAMNELRQIASVPEAQTDGKISSPKVETLMEQLEGALANRHKVLVFVNYLAAVESIAEELNKRGIDYLTMTGSTRDRQKLVDRFQNDPKCQVFVLTLKTGGTGLNLTAADMVFIYDPWWNKAAENQAIDRAHRMGQQKKVVSYKLITSGTIEEKILKLQELKSALFEQIISSDSASLKSLSTEDIDFILGK